MNNRKVHVVQAHRLTHSFKKAFFSNLGNEKCLRVFKIPYFFKNLLF